MRTALATFLIALIRIYQRMGWALGMPSLCRFYPSCSEYSREAIRQFGPFKGIGMTAGRILRCHPLNPGGVDLPEMERK